MDKYKNYTYNQLDKKADELLDWIMRHPEHELVKEAWKHFYYVMFSKFKLRPTDQGNKLLEYYKVG
jgi:hypothetical protein